MAWRAWQRWVIQLHKNGFITGLLSTAVPGAVYQQHRTKEGFDLSKIHSTFWLCCNWDEELRFSVLEHRSKHTHSSQGRLTIGARTHFTRKSLGAAHSFQTDISAFSAAAGTPQTAERQNTQISCVNFTIREGNLKSFCWASSTGKFRLQFLKQFLFKQKILYESWAN